MTALDGQLELFAPEPEPAVPARTWADVRPGERVTYDVPGSPWRGTWTVRRIEPHPSAYSCLIVTMVDADGGRTWQTWRYPDRRADVTEDSP